MNLKKGPKLFGLSVALAILALANFGYGVLYGEASPTALRILWYLGPNPLGNDALLNPDEDSAVAIKVEGLAPGQKVRIVLCEEDWISDDDELQDLGIFTANGFGEVMTPYYAPPPHQVGDPGSESEVYALVSIGEEKPKCGCGRYRSPMIRINDEIVEESVATSVQELDASVNGGLTVPYFLGGIGGALAADVVARGRYRQIITTKSGALDPEVHLELVLLSDLPDDWKLALCTSPIECGGELTFSLWESHFSLWESHTDDRNLFDPFCAGEGSGRSCMPIYLDAYTPTPGTAEFEVHWKTYQEGHLVGEGSTDPMAVVAFGFKPAPHCAEKGVIKVWVEAWGREYAEPFLKVLSELIMSACPGVEVDILYDPEVINRYITALVAGSEQPTILLAPVLFYPRSPDPSIDNFLDLVKAGLWAPLEELKAEVTEKFPSAGDFMYEGVLYGVPFELVDWRWAFMVNPLARKDLALAFLRTFIYSLVRPFW